MMKIITPYRIQAIAAALPRTNQPRVISGTLGHQQDTTIEIRCELIHFGTELFEKRPQRVVENRVHGIETKSIDVAVGDPVARVLDEIVSDLIAVGPVEIDRRPPRRPISFREIRCE